MLRVWLFGVLRLEVDGVRVAPPSSRRARLLLAMLAVERRPHGREALAARLWPNVRDESARASLRTALTQLRTALGPDASRFLLATRERLTLAGPDEVWVDVGEFERLLQNGEVQPALALSGDELLTGLEDEWVYARRDELRQRLCEALALAANEAEAGGDLQSALLWTRRQVALDPLAEEPQRELIRRLTYAGDRPAALTAYDKFAKLLREKLGMAPSAAAHELITAVRGGKAITARPDGEAPAPASLADGGPVGRARLGYTLPRPLQSRLGLSFVGREEELVRLRELWMRTCGGDRVAVVISGEPGIGKTRLGAELAQRVHEQGALVLYGRCDEGLAVPYQPFVEVLRLYVGVVGVDRLRAELGHFVSELGRLLPEFAGLDEAVHSDPESERFALFEAVAAVVEMMTREQKALLVIDDLHWAARPTLLLLRHLIRSERPLGVLLLATYRETDPDPDHRLAQLLADLHRDASVERLILRGLDQRAIAALLEATGHPRKAHTSQLVLMLEAQTAGNPFFIRELLAHMTESGTISSAGKRSQAELQSPEGVRHVIDQRVARLSAPAGFALRLAAVAGPTFSFTLLERVLGARAGVLDGLDEAVAAGLLTETGHGNYAFAHALVRQTIYRGLGGVQRIRLHRQLGEALEAFGDAQAHIEALAHHFARAAPDGQGLKAATYALAAGRRAAARLGYEEAAAHYERGLQALTLSERPQQQQRCELLLALGEACWGTGDLDNARCAYRQAAELASGRDDAFALARAALGYCGPQRVELAAAVIEPVVELLQRALAAMGDGDSALRAQLMGRLAACTDVERLPNARRAREMARRIADKAVLADVLASTHVVHDPDAVHESLAAAAELRLVASEIGDCQLQALAHAWRLDHLLELGDVEGAERELDALQRLTRTRKERYFTWLLTALQANHAHLHGQLQQCEALAHDAFAHRYGGHDDDAVHIFTAQMMLVRQAQGRLDEFVQSLENLATQTPQLAAMRCGLAYVYVHLERDTQARQELDALARNDFGDIPRNTYWLALVALVSEVVVALDDVARAERLYKLLLPYADRHAAAFVAPCQGSVSRHLGLLATTMSHFENAAQHFKHALAMNARIKSPLWIAHTQHDYAHMLLLRNLPGDRDEALQLLNQALATAKQLGLKALVHQARPLKLAAEADTPPSAPARRA